MQLANGGSHLLCALGVESGVDNAIEINEREHGGEEQGKEKPETALPLSSLREEGSKDADKSHQEDKAANGKPCPPRVVAQRTLRCGVKGRFHPYQHEGQDPESGPADDTPCIGTSSGRPFLCWLNIPQAIRFYGFLRKFQAGHCTREGQSFAANGLSNG